MAVAAWPDLLLACFVLGALHAVVPDEHTWPITFSYSVGTASGRGGMRAGAFFAAAFTVQRAIMSQLVYLALATFFILSEWLTGPVYVVVGAAMAIAGYLILSDHVPHFHPFMRFSRRDLARHEQEVSRGHVPAHWAVIHGFIAGFGVDAGLFSTFVYFIAVPAMPTAVLGFAPGAVFGLGTFVVLMVIGLVFGGVLGIAKRWGSERVERFGRLVGARTLLLGGIAFVVAGIAFVLGASSLLPFDFGTVIVVLIMVGLALPIMLVTWREVRRDLPPPSALPG